MQHKIFGIKESAPYYDRYGAYLIVENNGKIAVIETEKGLFLIGGGIETGETDEECIVRECLEETGCSVIATLICEVRLGSFIRNNRSWVFDTK